MTSEADREHEHEQRRLGVDRPGLHGADLAALLGATVTVLLTMTNTPGAWGVISTIIGLLLLAVLLTFFWRRRPPYAGKKWESFFIGLALAAVMGFVVAIASAQAIQTLWFSDNGTRPHCRSVAVSQATTAVRDLSDISNNTGTLQRLVDDTLQHGVPPMFRYRTAAEGALKYHFYDEYYGAVDDCLAGETFESLWWIAVPSFLLTLVWWNWYDIKKFYYPG
jgi:hypothetical protein